MMSKSIIDLVQEYVRVESHKPTSHYGFEPYQFHFLPMVEYAKKLARELGADEEIVGIAAWLHDIGSIKFGRDDHHNTGAKLARELLTSLGYPGKKINLVERCILNHRSSIKKRCDSLEEKIISDADAMSNFDNVAGIFKAAYIYENMDQGEAAKSVREKLIRKWHSLYLSQSKKIIKPKYQAMLILLEGK